MFILIILMIIHYLSIYFKIKNLLSNDEKFLKSNKYDKIKFILIYQQGDNINECIDSLENQIIKPDEIIIIGNNIKLKNKLNNIKIIERKLLSFRLLENVISKIRSSDNIIGVFKCNTIFNKNISEKILNYYNTHICGKLYVLSNVITSNKFLEKFNFFERLNYYSNFNDCDYFTNGNSKCQSLIKNFLITKVNNFNLIEYCLEGNISENVFIFFKYFTFYLFPILIFIEYLVQLITQIIIIYQNLQYNQALETDIYFLLVANFLIFLKSNLPKINISKEPIKLNKSCKKYVKPSLKLINKVNYGKLYQVEKSNLQVLHLYGNCYQKGFAYGTLCKDDFKNMVNILNTIFQNSKPDKIIYETFKSKDDTLKGAVLNYYYKNEKYIEDNHKFMLKGISDSTDINLNDIIAITFIAELYHQHCLLLSRLNHHEKLFVRTLDHFFYTDKHILRVFHNSEKNSYCELGIPGSIWTISCVSDKLICLGDTSGRLNYEKNLEGKPYYFLFKDIIQNCDNIDKAKTLIEKTTRNNNLFIMITSLLENKSLLIESSKNLKFYDCCNFSNYLNIFSIKKIYDFNKDILFEYSEVDSLNNTILNMDDFSIDNINNSILKLYRTGGNHSMIVNDKYQMYISVNNEQNPGYNTTLYLFDLIELFKEEN